MMNEFKVSFNKLELKAKPNNVEAAFLSSVIGENVETINHDNIKAFVSLVGQKGCTFSPSTFKDGKRCKENVEQTQLLPLDFYNNSPLHG